MLAGDNADPLAVAQAFGADRLARDAVEHADQVGRGDDDAAVAPCDGIFVLEGDLETSAAVFVDALHYGVAAQEAFGRSALHVGDLAAKQQFAGGRGQGGSDRVFMGVAGPAHLAAEGDGLAGGVKDAVRFYLSAGARGFAGGGDRADLGAGFAADALHPFPACGTGDDDLVVADIGQSKREHWQIGDGKAGHLCFRVGAAHGVGIDHGQAGHGGDQQRLERVAAADFDRHHGGEAATEVSLHHPDRLCGEGGIG